MKRLLFAVLLLACPGLLFAQTTDTTATENVHKKKHKDLHVEAGFGHDEPDSTDDELHGHKAPGFSGGLTFSRFDLGLATLIDNGSFTLSPKNQFLDYRAWKTSNVGFDVLQFGYRFNSSFKIYLSGGFDWTLIRLRKDITIQKSDDRSQLHYTNDSVNYSKNRFSSSYLRIPLSFEFRTKDDASGRRAHFVFGPDVGFLLNGRVKQISDEFGKQKFNDDYHFTRFRYGAFARVGYGSLGIFAKYYFNDMFDTDQQKALKNFSFGITVGF